jgi:Poly(ADP-ribose) polymerase catalytic domain/WWE domain
MNWSERNSLTTTTYFFCLIILFGRNDAVDSYLQAQISCDAQYSAPCSHLNSKSHVLSLTNNHRALQNIKSFITNVSEGIYNQSDNFYPVVVEKISKKVVAIGDWNQQKYIGNTLEMIYSEFGMNYVDIDKLHNRFLEGAKIGGNWVSYLWKDQELDSSSTSRVAFVTNLTEEYYIFIGYEKTSLPTNLPCDSNYDSWCSLTNVQSVLGAIQFQLLQANNNRLWFEEIVRDITFSSEFRIEGGFYAFMFKQDGSFAAHGKSPANVGKQFSEVFISNGLGNLEEAEHLFEKLVLASKNSLMIRYRWRNSPSESVYQKIAYVVSVTFEIEEYFLGVGFSFVMPKQSATVAQDTCSDEYSHPCAFAQSLALSSHVFSFLLSSSTNVLERFWAITSNEDGEFRSDDFYPFIYRYDDQVCQAHKNEDFVGMPLWKILVENKVRDINESKSFADELHNQFKAAADKPGGGWVKYPWRNDGKAAEKIAYIFQFRFEGLNYYGGVGFTNMPLEQKVLSDYGTKKDGMPIKCSSQYNLPCSKKNAESILGQAMSKLTVYTSSGNGKSFNDVYDNITKEIDKSLFVNDFFVAVFSIDSDYCKSDTSGCCVAHGRNASYVHLSWQEILDEEKISFIEGAKLHEILTDVANNGYGIADVQWSEQSIVRTRRFLISKFSRDDKAYYALTSYVNKEPPESCNNCTDSQECTRPDQEYCEAKISSHSEEAKWISIFSGVFIVFTLALVVIVLKYRRSKGKKEKIKMEIKLLAEKMSEQMKGVLEVIVDIPIQSKDDYDHMALGFQNTSLREYHNTLANWYWKEDEDKIQHHRQEMLLPSSTFVRYSDAVSKEIENAFQNFKTNSENALIKLDLTDKIISTPGGAKICNQTTGLHYDIDFEKMEQRNCSTNHVRKIHREQESLSIAIDTLQPLPTLPDDLKIASNESLLPTITGQIIQVSKYHNNNSWLYGHVLYDPVLEDAQNNNLKSHAMNKWLAEAMHSRPTSGWFPKMVTKEPDNDTMQKLTKKFSKNGAAFLERPKTWTNDPNDLRVVVDKGGEECEEVVRYFKQTMRHPVRIVLVERIQNLPLWQTYAVKKETVQIRHDGDIHNRIHNKTQDIERKWLFHGTTRDIVPKIERQGFNRAFAGRNAVAYGRGVYFATESEYSSNKAYAQPDSNQIQRMFLCRVVVGDWCLGQKNQLTPDSKPYKPLELFDTTVNNELKPSVFVVYHDAQAYPEYLVSFVRLD